MSSFETLPTMSVGGGQKFRGLPNEEPVATYGHVFAQFMLDVCKSFHRLEAVRGGSSSKLMGGTLTRRHKHRNGKKGAESARIILIS